MTQIMNSPLVEYTKKSPNHSGPRTHTIDTITPHCAVGQISVESLGNIFSKVENDASSNYGVGCDGRVALYVDETNRSWCSSNRANDQRAVTIECASDSKHPYAFNSAVYYSLIDLCVDICKRHEKKKLLWLKTKERTLSYSPKPDEMLLTVHRWFDAKECPGEWMMDHMQDLADQVTKKLSGHEPEPTLVDNSFTVKVSIDNLNIRKGPGTNFSTIGRFTGKGVFTIVDTSVGQGASEWGKLKSGLGWISLDYADKL